MRVHQVEVDDEVFEFVKAHAEPLEDTFNSALRRLLRLGNRERRRKFAQGQNQRTLDGASLPSFPTGTPQALTQILTVVQLVRKSRFSRTEATRMVASQLNVAPQTVLDKYCRQLQLTARDFDRLLEQNDLGELRGILKSRFPPHLATIDHVIRLCMGNSGSVRQFS